MIEDKNEKMEKPKITASLTLFSESEGGRKHSFREGYCPHLVVEGSSEWLGVRVVNLVDDVKLGQTQKMVRMSSLRPHSSFELRRIC